MDLFTQIVLGAGCGEAVLGKKIGNKALLFGAIGGTIPDWDVFIGPWIYDNEIQAMVFHRGFMHSILFSIVGAYIFGWLVHRLYDTNKREGTTSMRDWIMLFFWSLFTHPLLDSFTPYGTQLFAPFSDYRVAFNTISVADPLYTLPFLIAIIVLMFFNRKSSKRRLWLNIGFGISTAYMLFTIGNKFYMDSIFKKSLLEAEIEYERFRVQPTILNNLLWYGIVESEDHYYGGFYSLLDNGNRVQSWHQFPKNHHLLSTQNPNVALLAWFSDDYYNIFEFENPDEYKYNDLRYPSLDSKNANNSIFSFRVYKTENGYDAEQYFDKPPSAEDFKIFFNRIMGE